MKILVTGGGGFLGSSICRQLTALGHEVVAFQRSPAKHLEAAGIRTVRGDITHLEQVCAAAQGAQAIVHTAGKAGVWGDPEDYRRINVTGTNNVIEACRSQAISVLVHTSSPSIVHAGGDIAGADESLPIADHFSAPYPATKAEAEKRVTAANSSELKTVSLRPHLIWGPGDPHILPRLAAKASGGTLALPGPVYIRLGRPKEKTVYTQEFEYHIGKADILQEGKDIAILACGGMVGHALSAADLLRDKMKMPPL